MNASSPLARSWANAGPRVAVRVMQAAANPRFSRWQFVAVCCYIAAQVYLLPIAARGPSWAVWPKFADLVAAGMLALCPLLLFSKSAASPAARIVFVRMLVAFTGCAASFFLVNLMLVRAGRGLAVSDGVYYLYRLLQVAAVYWVASQVVYTPRRVGVLRFIATGTFVATCALVLLTFAEVVPGPSLVSHLPGGRVAGAWAPYFVSQARGLGAVGYNHAYVAAQILLLLALKFVLDDRPRSLANSILLLLGIVAAFASGSRAGLAAMLLYAFCLFARNPVYIPIVGVLLFLASMFVPGELLSGDVAGMAAEHGKLADPMQAVQFRARVEIWRSWFDLLCREPDLLITGIGFGGTRGDQAIGSAPHSMPAMVLVECGVLGLMVYAWLVFVALDMLRRVEPAPKPLLWASISLLFGALTQETFYPVAAMGHFLVLYMGTLAIALQLPTMHRAAQEEAVTGRPEAAALRGPRFTVGPWTDRLRRH